MWNGKKKAVTFSYDDGVEQDRRLIALFNKYGMKATFNQNSGIQTRADTFTQGNIVVHRMNQDLQEKEPFSFSESKSATMKLLPPTNIRSSFSAFSSAARTAIPTLG